MRIGTRSVLYGFHSFWIHPWFVAVAWWKLFGFPFDPRLWIAFFVHDLGYIGKPNMDGPEGEAHVELGARIMSVFGDRWRDECLLHSRFYCRRLGRPISRLGIADKLAICLTPRWLWKRLVTATGEIQEYLTASKFEVDLAGWCGDGSVDKLDVKYSNMTHSLLQWVAEQMSQRGY